MPLEQIMMWTVKFWGDMISPHYFQNVGCEKWQKAKLMYFQTQLLILMDFQYLPVNIGFTMYTSKYRF